MLRLPDFLVQPPIDDDLRIALGGCAVISLLGQSFMGRWTASMLHKIRLDKLVAKTREEYIDLAGALASDSERLAALRAGLRARAARSALCDGGRTTRSFERAVRAVWRKWCRGQGR